MIPFQVFTLQQANKAIFRGDFFSATRLTKFTNSESKIWVFPRYKHICLRAPGKYACNAMSMLQTQPRYGYMFPVNQRCVYNEYLLYGRVWRCLDGWDRHHPAEPFNTPPDAHCLMGHTGDRSVPGFFPRLPRL